MRARQGARVIAVLSALSMLGACAGTPAATTASSAPPSSASTKFRHGRLTNGSAIGCQHRIGVCCAGVVHCPGRTGAHGGGPAGATNAGRSADSQLTVTDTDVHCQDVWAVVGANDLVNKAQYTFAFQRADGQWQRIPDRNAACAGQQIPDQLYNLACRTN